MNDQEKKATQEETPKDQKIELTDEEAEAAAGGGGFKPIKDLPFHFGIGKNRR